MPQIFASSVMFRSFLNLSANSCSPDYGKKGLESYMVKSSGGYVEKFSRQSGELAVLLLKPSNYCIHTRGLFHYLENAVDCHL